MKRQSLSLFAAVVLMSALPLWLLPRPESGAEMFTGSDGKAQAAIGEISPNYQPWFSPLLEPAGKEIESLLFALQAACGAGMIGYWLGAAVTREKARKEAERPRALAAEPDRRAD